MSTAYRVHDGIAIITLENPPVNGLGHATRAGIVAGLTQAQADAQVRAIIVIGAGRAFSGGADIREFNTPKAIQSPLLVDVIVALESCSKPVVAAIHAVAMGGGLELALGCHYRVAVAGAQIALPEVKLGLLPGAGGTQRLPRAVGLARALDMVVTGKSVKSEQLAQAGLFDRMIDGDLLTGAMAFANEVSQSPAPYPRLRDRTIDDADGHAATLIAEMRERVQRESAHFPAPQKCVAAIAASLTQPFDEGLKFERECFVSLVQSPESKALRHAFLGERAAGKIADVADDTPVRAIEHVAVIGAGTMGVDIAVTFANVGMSVTLLDTTDAAWQRARETIRTHYEGSTARGKLTADDAEKRLGRIAGTTSYTDIASADLIVETVIEDLEVKQAVFRQLDAVAKPGAIFASNTSTLRLAALAAVTQRPQDVVGMHVFRPTNVAKLLEVVRGEATGKDVLATVMKLAKRIGKLAVVASGDDGHIGHRMFDAYFQQAQWMVEAGATPAQVDAAIEHFGMKQGPFRLRETTVVDAQGQGVACREFSDEEIVERLVFALVNEGAKMLTQGIVARASDIDMVSLHGYGFPLWRGGPMWYADHIGLDKVLARLREFASGWHGAAWSPAPRLVELAALGQRFTG